MNNLGKTAKKVALSQEKGIVLLPTREHSIWAEHGHDEEEEHHHHGRHDMHIWLSPDNVEIMLLAVARNLGEADPAHKTAYEKNASNAIKRLNQFDASIKQKLAPYSNTPFIVFHDAYQYFEKHYGLHSVGTLTLSSEVPLGAATLSNIAKAVREHKVHCMFTEPQYDPKRMQVIAEHTNSSVSVLDPLETSAVLTKEGYGALLNNVAESMVSCFQKHTDKE
jgi:zinc transport system substrate-binding protein